MKRILVISWFYPPINSSEALVTYKLLSHSRYAYDVFTQKRSDAWSYGRSMDVPEAENVCCIEAESDDIRSWAEEAIRYFAAHRDDYDIVMTRSMPPECHQAGLRIKKRFPKVKWIASFGDPIRENPYELMGGAIWSPYSMKNRINRNRSLRFRLSPLRPVKHVLWTLRHLKAVQRRRELDAIETGAIRHADRLIFNNTSQLRYMSGNLDLKGRGVVLRHSFDPALYPSIPHKKNGNKLRFVFLGQLNTVRTALPLFHAIERLKASLPDLPDRAEFLFFGDISDADLAAILRLDIGDVVHFKKPISYRQSLAEAAAADWLVHIDGNISAVTEENVFFAGKLADYFGAGRPILAITMPKGDTADCLRRAGALLLSYSVNEIKQALVQIIFRGMNISMNEAYMKGFSSQYVAAMMDEKVVKPLL